MIYEKLLQLLESNKRFPHYAAERRIDIFINFFLEDILTAYYKKKVIFVAPEFPLKHKSNNQTVQVDYLCAFKKTRQPIFVELKTDPLSFKVKQMELYCMKAANWSECIDELNKIIEKGHMRFSYRQKYFYLIRRLLVAKLIEFANEKGRAKYLSLKDLNKNHKQNKAIFSRKLIEFTQQRFFVERGNFKAKLLYLGPAELKQEIDKCESCKDKVELLDFNRISNPNFLSDIRFQEEFKQLIDILK